MVMCRRIAGPVLCGDWAPVRADEGGDGVAPMEKPVLLPLLPLLPSGVLVGMAASKACAALDMGDSERPARAGEVEAAGAEALCVTCESGGP